MKTFERTKNDVQRIKEQLSVDGVEVNEKWKSGWSALKWTKNGCCKMDEKWTSRKNGRIDWAKKWTQNDGDETVRRWYENGCKIVELYVKMDAKWMTR